MKKYLLAFSLIALLLSGCGAGRVYNVAKPSIEQTLTKEQMKDALHAAIQRYRWTVVEESPEKIVVEYTHGIIMAKIAISYTMSSYDIDYVASENLKYNGTSIHKKYNGWVKNLEKEIDNNIQKISKGQKLRYSRSVSVAPVAVSGTTAAAATVTTATGATAVLASSTSKKKPKQSCKKTFHFTGSLWKGRVITAKQSISNISKEQAVVQAASILSTEGFIVDTTSPNVGLISAHEVKSGGHTLPINLMFSEDTQSGVLAKLTVSTPAGESFNVGAMKGYLCGNIMGKLKSTGYVKEEKVKKAPVATSMSSSKKDVGTRLKALQKLYVDKLITKKEYEKKKSNILEDL